MGKFEKNITTPQIFFFFQLNVKAGWREGNFLKRRIIFLHFLVLKGGKVMFFFSLQAFPKFYFVIFAFWGPQTFWRIIKITKPNPHIGLMLKKVGDCPELVFVFFLFPKKGNKGKLMEFYRVRYRKKPPNESLFLTFSFLFGDILGGGGGGKITFHGGQGGGGTGGD